MDEREPIIIDGTSLTIERMVLVANGWPIKVAEHCWDTVARSRQVVVDALAAGESIYGVNTGVGSQKTDALLVDQVRTFNRKLIVAHATVADDRGLSEETCRGALALQIHLFVRGESGVRPELVRALLQQLGRRIPPATSVGSVGASDLSPLAQLALPLIGIPSPLAPDELPDGDFELEAKEALSLMSSNAVSLAMAARELSDAKKLLRRWTEVYCLSLEGFRGSLENVGPHFAGPAFERIRELLDSSELWKPGQARFLQDPLSFRCAPDVFEAADQCLATAWAHCEQSLNRSVDNPAVSLTERRLISHGRMDTTAHTLSVDTLRLAIGKLCDVSTQRLHKQHWSSFSGLPSGLAEVSDAASGVQFLNLGHVAESAVIEARLSASPVIGQYTGQLAEGVEDQSSPFPASLLALHSLIHAAATVMTVEALVACWAIHRRGIKPGQLGKGVRHLYERIAPLLPIGKEGERVFDLRPIRNLLWNPDTDPEPPPIS